MSRHNAYLGRFAGAERQLSLPPGACAPVGPTNLMQGTQIHYRILFSPLETCLRARPWRADRPTFFQLFGCLHRTERSSVKPPARHCHSRPCFRSPTKNCPLILSSPTQGLQPFGFGGSNDRCHQHRPFAFSRTKRLQHLHDLPLTRRLAGDDHGQRFHALSGSSQMLRTHSTEPRRQFLT